MGFYIEHLKDGTRWKSPRSKAEQLVADGAVDVFGKAIVFQPNLVCIVENGSFDAACFVYNQQEFGYCMGIDDGRRTRWVVYEGSIDITRISADLAKYHEWEN